MESLKNSKSVKDVLTFFVLHLHFLIQVHLYTEDAFAFEARTSCFLPLIAFTFCVGFFLVINEDDQLDPTGHIKKIKSLVRPYFGCCILALIYTELQYESGYNEVLKVCISTHEKEMAIAGMISKCYSMINLVFEDGPGFADSCRKWLKLASG